MPTNPTGRDELVERVARALIEPLGYPAGVDWEHTWVGNQCDDVETGSLAHLCRSLARAAIATTDTEMEEAEHKARDEGADYVLGDLANMLGLEEWEAKDGSETWEGDVSATLYGILDAARVVDPWDNSVARHARLHEERAHAALRARQS